HLASITIWPRAEKHDSAASYGSSAMHHKTPNLEVPQQKYRRNHYVPEWYQHRFLPEGPGEKKFYYLDLKPERRVSNGHVYVRNELLRWGPDNCFSENDLYTTKIGPWESTEIEEKFFGKVDSFPRFALDYFADFQHPNADPEPLHALLPYMSIQKLRTPKG